MPSAIGAPGAASAASASTPGHVLLLSPNDPVPNPRVQRLRDEMRNHELNRDLGQSDVGKLVRGYILCRPDRELIIGDGIVGLFGGFVQSEDKNLNEPRWDFVAFRVDDTVARFHPSKINAGKVVIQPLEVFRWEGDVPAQSLVVPPGPPPGASASASTPAPAPPDAPATTRASIRRMPDGSFEGYHAADLISAKQAKAWLMERVQQVRDGSITNEEFTVELVGNEAVFKWHLFLNTKIPHQVPYVTSCRPTWEGEANGRPGFRVVVKEGEGAESVQVICPSERR